MLVGRIAILLTVSLLAFADHSLVGRWKFEEVVYRTLILPRPNPDLNMIWSFTSDNRSELYWDRGGKEFCQRWARYQLSSHHLVEIVTDVNSDNAPDCSKDLDMQIGRRTKTKYCLKDHKLYLHFSLGDEEIVYILHRQN